MPDRCVVFGCSNLANAEKGISLHRIPFLNDNKSEAIRRKKRWINFVRARCDKWVPTKNSAVCSEHFAPESFSRRYSVVSESESTFSPRLIRDNFGIVAYPTIHAKIDTELTTREQRMVCIFMHIKCISFIFLNYCTLYGILMYGILLYLVSVHSLKIKRKWMLMMIRGLMCHQPVMQIGPVSILMNLKLRLLSS